MKTYLHSHIEHCMKFAEPLNKNQAGLSGIVVFIVSMGVGFGFLSEAMI